MTRHLLKAVATEQALLLLQWPVAGGPVLVFELPLAAMLAHLAEPCTPVPAPVRAHAFTRFREVT